MAQFSRKFLKTIMVGDKGLSDDQIDAIVDLHAEVVNGLMEELKTAKAAAEKLVVVQKELDEAKTNNGDTYKTKYEKEHSEFEAFKKSVTEKEAAAAKSAAVKAYFESKGIKGDNLDIAMRGAMDETDSVEFEDGKAYVYRLTSAEKDVENQKWERIPVELGISDGVYVVVKSGVSTTDLLRGILKN